MVKRKASPPGGMMLEKGTQLLKILKQAIKAESEGYYFYQMAGEKSEDPNAKEIFKSLAQDELDHGSVLKGLYHAIMKRSEYKFDHRRHHQPKSKSGSPRTIFSAKFKQRIKQNNFAISAMRIAQMLEKDAIKFYSQHAKRSNHPELKSLFNFLVKWETDHLWTLVRQENLLKKEQ
jgi:rubrerythrin